MKPSDFFEAELQKTQVRFNQTFGEMAVCNLKTRYAVIMAIVQMGLLQRKISAAHDKDLVRDEIRQFIRARDVLKKLFDQAQEIVIQQQERRQHAKRDTRKNYSDATGNGRRISGSLQGMRECVSGGMA